MKPLCTAPNSRRARSRQCRHRPRTSPCAREGTSCGTSCRTKYRGTLRARIHRRSFLLCLLMKYHLGRRGLRNPFPGLCNLPCIAIPCPCSTKRSSAASGSALQHLLLRYNLDRHCSCTRLQMFRGGGAARGGASSRSASGAPQAEHSWTAACSPAVEGVKRVCECAPACMSC